MIYIYIQNVTFYRNVYDPTFIPNYHAMYIFSFTAKLPDVSPLAVSSSLHFQKQMNLHLLRLSATAAGAVQLYS